MGLWAGYMGSVHGSTVIFKLGLLVLRSVARI
jgi:hypothetical protein